MKKPLGRTYVCRSDNEDAMSVTRCADDGDDSIIRFGCREGHEGERFVYLNSKQISNLIELITEWHADVAVDPTASALWVDNT